MTAVHDFEQLVAFLNTNQVPHTLNAELQLVELTSNAGPLPGNLVVKWEKLVPFVQVIHVMIEGVPADRVREVETALVRLDNRLEVGGFGFDHDRRNLYCRLSIPVLPPDGLNPTTLAQLGNGVIRNAMEFLQPFQEVIEGKPGDQIAAIYEAFLAKRKLELDGAEA
jgi:hypothetical protein